MAKNKKTFTIDINISTIDETTNERKNYSLCKEYDGDPNKMAIDVMIDGWFIENNIDKSLLKSLYVNVYEKCSDELMYY